MADLSIHRRKVVAVDRRGAGRDGACQALRVVVCIAGHARFRRHARAGHLQQVELRCPLEERALVLWQGMQVSGVAPHHAHLTHALDTRAGLGAVPELSNRQEFQPSDVPGLAVD